MNQANEYCWAVTCKNEVFHRERNPFHGHRVLRKNRAPAGRFRVRCDECGKEYSYEPADVLSVQQNYRTSSGASRIG
jgi:hypothetical protein